MSAAFTVQVAHGSDKHHVELVAGSSTTVAQLKAALAELTEVPPDSQKIIFKGKTLQDGEQEVGGLGMKAGSKLILLRRRHTEEQEGLLKEVRKVLRSVDDIEAKIRGISEEVEGIEKGFLQSELVGEACRGLEKRTVTCSELLMQALVKLDTLDIPASEALVRGTRKAGVVRIQAILKHTDELAGRIDKCRTPI